MNKDIAMENEHNFCKGRFCFLKLWCFHKGVSKHMGKGDNCSNIFGKPRLSVLPSKHPEMPWDKAKVLTQIRIKGKKEQGSRRYKANASRGWWSRINHDISVHAQFLFLSAKRHSRHLTAATMEPLAVQQPQRLPWMSLSSQVTFLVKE